MMMIHINKNNDIHTQHKMLEKYATQTPAIPFLEPQVCTPIPVYSIKTRSLMLASGMVSKNNRYACDVSIPCSELLVERFMCIDVESGFLGRRQHVDWTVS